MGCLPRSPAVCRIIPSPSRRGISAESRWRVDPADRVEVAEKANRAVLGRAGSFMRSSIGGRRACIECRGPTGGRADRGALPVPVVDPPALGPQVAQGGRGLP
jgi:hypothetical protein